VLAGATPSALMHDPGPLSSVSESRPF
jgi:hypothetical protein